MAPEVPEALLTTSGVYQVLVILLLSLPQAWNAMESMGSNFLWPRQEFWCANATSYEEVDVAVLGLASVDGHVVDLWHQAAGVDNRTSSGCEHGYEYDTTTYGITATSEFNLVEGNQWILEMLGPMYMAGVGAGSFISGMLSDKIGRKKTFLWMSVLHFVSTIAVGLAPSVWVFAVARMIQGVGIKAQALSAMTLMLELVSEQYRVTAGLIFQILYTVGVFAVVCMAFVFRNFRLIELSIAASVIVKVFYFWLIPESPRWLLAKGHREKAMNEIVWIAERTGKNLPEELVREYSEQKMKDTKTEVEEDYKQFSTQTEDSQSLKMDDKDTEDDIKISVISGKNESQIISKRSEIINGNEDETKENPGSTAEQNAESIGYMDLVRHPTMRFYTLTIFFCVPAVKLIYNGLELSMGTLEGNINININIMLASIIDLPVFIGAIWIVKKLGCFRVINLYFVISLVTMFTAVGMLNIEDAVMVSTYLSLIGRTIGGASGSIIWIYLTELYPTALRQRTVGTASSLAGFISIAAPVIGGTLYEVWQPLPIIIFGSVATMALLLFLRMPDTTGCPMATSIEDSINIRKMRRHNRDSELSFGGRSNRAFTLDDDRWSSVKGVNYLRTEKPKHEPFVM